MCSLERLADGRALPAAEALTELREELCWNPAPRAAGGLCGGREGPWVFSGELSSPSSSPSALQEGMQVSAEVSMAQESCCVQGTAG